MGKKRLKDGACIEVCMGEGCRERHAAKIRAKLKELAAERGLDDRIRIEKVPCVGRCGKGPHLTLEPGGKTYSGVKKGKLKKILKKAADRL